MEPRGRVMAHPCGSITTRVYKDRLFSRRGLSVDQDGDNNSCWDRISQVRPSMRFNWNDEDWSSWGGKDGFAEVLYLDEIQHLLSKGWGNSTYRTKLFPPYSVGNFLVQKYLQLFKRKRLFKKNYDELLFINLRIRISIKNWLRYDFRWIATIRYKKIYV